MKRANEFHEIALPARRTVMDPGDHPKIRSPEQNVLLVFRWWPILSEICFLIF